MADTLAAVVLAVGTKIPGVAFAAIAIATALSISSAILSDEEKNSSGFEQALMNITPSALAQWTSEKFTDLGDLSEHIGELLSSGLDAAEQAIDDGLSQAQAEAVAAYIAARDGLSDYFFNEVVPDLVIMTAVAGFKLAQIAAGRKDPLVLDLYGDGISTIGNAVGARFDFQGDGFREATGWIAATDGLLVRDLNGNGSIDNGGELFGDRTRLPNGSLALAGFQALAALDSNGDGVISDLDAAWGELRVWQDLNGDGQSSANELKSLEEVGVASIALQHEQPSVPEALGDGNEVFQWGTFTRTDGTSGVAASLLLDRNPVHSTPSVAFEESPLVGLLPDLPGMGLVRSLRQAMASQPALLASVKELLVTPLESKYAKFEQMVIQWSGATSVPAWNVRGDMNARKLAVLEALYGLAFINSVTNDAIHPLPQQTVVLTRLYDQVVKQFYSIFLLQTDLAPYVRVSEVAGDSGDISLSVDVDMISSIADKAQVAWIIGDIAQAFNSLDLVRSSEFLAFIDAVEVMSPQNTTFTGTSGTDIIVLQNGGNIVNAGDGNDVVYGASYNDVVTGGAGADSLYGNGGSDILYGGDGNDYLGSSSGWGRSTGMVVYVGGKGNDQLGGSEKADIYVFRKGDGHDTITEASVVGDSGVVDTLVLGAGILANETTIKRSGVDVILTFGDGTDSVTFKNWLYNANHREIQVEVVRFADGTVWTSDHISQEALRVVGTAGADTLTAVEGYSNVLLGMSGNDVLNGGSGDDYLDGGDGDDTLRGGLGSNTIRGGKGNDTLIGSNGTDTFLFDLGDGSDKIVETDTSNAVDVLRFGEGIAPEDITVARDGTSLLLRHQNGTDQVRIEAWYAGINRRIEFVEFANGIVWSEPQLTQMGLTLHAPAAGGTLAGLDQFDNILLGGDGNDILNGGRYKGHDRLYGGKGNDILRGGSGGGTNYLDGGEGNDTIIAESESTIVGGLGNDNLQGSASGDLYLFDLGDGDDIILEYGGNDVIRFGPGITAADLTMNRTGFDMVVSHSNGTDKLTIREWYRYAERQIELFEFADGSHLSAADLSLRGQVLDISLPGASANRANLATVSMAAVNDLLFADDAESIDTPTGLEMVGDGVGLADPGESTASVMATVMVPLYRSEDSAMLKPMLVA